MLLDFLTMTEKEFKNFQNTELMHIENITPLETSIAEQLKKTFGSADYWQLSKRWKQLEFEETARIIVRLIDLNKEAENLKNG